MMEWIYPLILSTIAGLATGLGALIKELGERTFGFGTGFAAGIMVTMSFFELILEPWKISGPFLTTVGFATGSLLMFLFDFLLPIPTFRLKKRV